VKVALYPSNAKRLYMDEKSTETGEIKEENIKVKRKSEGLLCMTSTLQPV